MDGEGRHVILSMPVMNDEIREYLRYPRPLWRWWAKRNWSSWIMVPWCLWFGAEVESSWGAPWWVAYLLVTSFAALACWHVSLLVNSRRQYQDREAARQFWEGAEGRTRKQLTEIGMSIGLIDQVVEHYQRGEVRDAARMVTDYLREHGDELP